MLYESGNAESLLDVGNKFIIFLQKVDNNKSYKLVDDRLNSFYGATVQIDVNDNDKYYLSMEYQSIDVTKSYKDFIDNYSGYCSEYVDYTKRYEHANSTMEFMSKYGNLNIFSGNGEFISFGLHTMYDSNLWMCEQGGICADEETYAQLNSCNLLPTAIRYTVSSGQYISNQTIPYVNYPGIGFPLLTISDSDKKLYNVEENGINYFFTKDTYGITITTMIENGGANPPLWQSIEFGVLTDSPSIDNILPLYIGGGTQGIKDDYMYCEAYMSPNMDMSKTFYGNVISLDMYNPCLSNSNVLNSTKFNYSNGSNFKVLTPSGKWNNIYSYYQNGIDKNSSTKEPYRLYDYGFLLNNSPSDYNYMDLYSITDNNYFGYESNKVDFPISSIGVFLNEDSELGFYGNINNVYSINSKSILGGIITLDNKKYLCVPCGWDYRQLLYSKTADIQGSNKIGTVVNGITVKDKDVVNESLAIYYDNIHNMLRNNYINSKILIRLEE